MKQEGNTGQAPGSTMRFVKPASWMKLLLSNLASLSRIRTICINLLPTNLMVLHPIIQSPLSNFHNVPCWCGLLLKSWENSMSRVLITSPVRSDALQSPEIMVQPVQRAARKLPVVCGTENTLKNWQIASKLKNISSSYCAVIASQNISLRCEGCHDTMTNDTLFLLLGGRVARKSRGV